MVSHMIYLIMHEALAPSLRSINYPPSPVHLLLFANHTYNDADIDNSQHKYHNQFTCIRRVRKPQRSQPWLMSIPTCNKLCTSILENALRARRWQPFNIHYSTDWWAPGVPSPDQPSHWVQCQSSGVGGKRENIESIRYSMDYLNSVWTFRIGTPDRFPSRRHRCCFNVLPLRRIREIRPLDFLIIYYWNICANWTN